MAGRKMTRSQKPVVPREIQRGQAMVFTLAFGVATALVTLVLFNSGMLANAKGRLQNSVDAGAYSASVLQARDHNFSSYMNRAMVANQAAVAQLASMKSYLEDAADTHDRLDEGLLELQADLHPVDKPLWDAAESLPIQNVESTYSSMAPAVVRALDLLIRGFQAAQEAHHLATAVNIPLIADEVIKRNDAAAAMTTGAFRTGNTLVQVQSWRDYTSKHEANGNSAVSDRFADVVVSDQSTDDFTRDRPSVPLPSWAMTESKFCILTRNVAYISSNTTFAFAHTGGTILSSDKKRWLALDATVGGGVVICTYYVPCFPNALCPTTDVTPLFDLNGFDIGGSGGAVVGANGDYEESDGYHNNPSEAKDYGDSLSWISPTYIAARDRFDDQGPGSSMDTAGGLQDYYRDVADPIDSIPENQTAELNGGAVGVTIEAERTAATIRTSRTILPNSDRLRLDEGMKGNTMRALAAGQSYFYRPREAAGGFTHGGWARGDGRKELANLFSPYWQARLADRSTADRAASWAAQ
jgi:hypothetical protein